MFTLIMSLAVMELLCFFEMPSGDETWKDFLDRVSNCEQQDKLTESWWRHEQIKKTLASSFFHKPRERFGLQKRFGRLRKNNSKREALKIQDDFVFIPMAVSVQLRPSLQNRLEDCCAKTGMVKKEKRSWEKTGIFRRTISITWKTE